MIVGVVFQLLILCGSYFIHINCINDELFSGFYHANNEFTWEVYGAAWLAPVERVFKHAKEFRGIRNLEGASLVMVMKKYELNLMTRDYFDFHVSHLSCSTNGIANSTSDAYLAQALSEKLKKTTNSLKNENFTPKQPSDNRLKDKTVAIITFTISSGSSKYKDNPHQESVRIEYFLSTFWSVRRYIPHIVVAVPLKRDYELLVSLNLPIWYIADLRQLFDETAERHHYRSRWFLPKHAMLFLITKLKYSRHMKSLEVTDNVYLDEVRSHRSDSSSSSSSSDSSSSTTSLSNSIYTDKFAQFDYVYYTEADQILYMRSQTSLMNALDSQNHTLLLVPHRMHTLIIPQVYPNLMDYMPPGRVNNVKDIHLITENTDFAYGSCCDNGRFVFKNCGNFWYLCTKWGLRNYTEWVRYGPDGYPMPMGTAHGARCTYSTEKKLCPVPSPACEQKRMPSNIQVTGYNIVDDDQNIPFRAIQRFSNRDRLVEKTKKIYEPLCDEIPNIEFTYGYISEKKKSKNS